MDFRAIILRLLWRIAPVLWLEHAVTRLIDWAVDLLAIEEECAWLDADRSYANWFGGWLAVIEARIDELIEARAYQILSWRWPTRAVPPHSPALGVRSCEGACLRLRRLIDRYNEIERLARRRAEKLQRLKDAARIELIPDHRLRAGEDDFVPGDHVVAGNPIGVGGVGGVGGARIRAPPWLSALSENPAQPSPQQSTAGTRPHA